MILLTFESSVEDWSVDDEKKLFIPPRPFAGFRFFPVVKVSKGPELYRDTSNKWICESVPARKCAAAVVHSSECGVRYFSVVGWIKG